MRESIETAQRVPTRREPSPVEEAAPFPHRPSRHQAVRPNATGVRVVRDKKEMSCAHFFEKFPLAAKG